MFSLVLIILFAYLVGSFPTSIVVGRMTRRIDIREHGSKNAGGTNAFRVLGWKAGLFVAVVDILKGVLATLLVAKIRVDSLTLNYELVQIIAGTSAVIGHVWTVLAKFKGGKGVATGAGMIVALFPWASLICFIIFAALVLTTRYVSLGSIIATSSLPFILLTFDRIFGKSVSNSLLTFSILISGLILFTHRSNIRRLFNGTENRFEKLQFRKKL
ncbi:MAG: glycerol-3-phosphate 1-O-acyltransferase [Caldithrix sp.]|nr:MAG: glycerol-3-phosphate 1-O-acyltransferase [Caldithrix sp.]TDI88622.1 MAG: glycerol-3-phosphate 1-O-acyltransferase [Caldithrix sp.]